MGRIVGIEPTRVGTTIQCVNHFTKSAITNSNLAYYLIIVNVFSYFSKIKIAMIIKITPPKVLEDDLIFCFIAFPKFKPIYVNIRLVIENIIGGKRIFLVIAVSPSPTVKLSRLTDKPKSIYPKMFNLTFSFSSEKIKFKPTYNNIKNAIIFIFINFIFFFQISRCIF